MSMDILENCDDDILSCFSMNDDDGEDSADEILGMIDGINEKDNNSRFINDEDSGIDDDTEAKIAALQAQIELLKSTKKSAEKSSQKVVDTCKHGKSASQCFFCSPQSQATSPEKSGKIKESLNDKEKVELKLDISKEKESSILISAKRRLAHEGSNQFGNPPKKAKIAKGSKKEINDSKRVSKSCIEDASHLFGGIDINNPLVSSTLLEERMQGRKLVKISKIQSTIKDDTEGDWVTIGVIVNKLVQKKSSSGKNFCVWHLSDLCLGTENEIVALFLFGQSYQEHWKIQVGTVIALLNPTLLKQDKYTNQGPAISIDNPKKLMELGYARQLSQCKGVRKSDGRCCTMYINKKYGDYCEYHVQSAFKKAKAGRMEFQSGGRVPTKGKLIENLKKNISQGAYHYGGKTVMLQEEYRRGNSKMNCDDNKKGNDKKGLKSVMGRDILKEAAKQFNLIKAKREIQGKQPSSGPVTAKAFLNENKSELLNISTANKNSANKSEEKLVVKRKLCDIQLLEAKEANTSKKCSPDGKLKVKKCSPYLKPVLGRGLKGDDIVDFGDDDLSYDKYTGEEEQTLSDIFLKKKSPNGIKDQLIDKVTTSCGLQKSSRAKRKAISVIQCNGPIVLPEPNQVVGKKKSPTSKEIIEKRVANSVETKEKTTKKKSLLAGVLGKIDLNSESGKKLLQQKSKNVGAVRLVEAEREEKYFDSLEKKESMQEKMANTYEIKVTGIACRECRYLAESQSQLCRELKHPVAKINNVVKRFFACKKCKQRCCSYNKLIPKNPCVRCGETNFERAAMATERKGPLIGGETLEVRGREQKYIITL